MKAIRLWQPWASLIALGHKTIETRSWPTKYRGPLWWATSGRGGSAGCCRCVHVLSPFSFVDDRDCSKCRMMS